GVGDAALQLHLASAALVVLGDQLERLVVEGHRLSLGPAPPRQLGCREQIADGPLRVAGLAPVVREYRRRSGFGAGFLLPELRHRRVALTARRPWERPVGDVPDQLVLERELFVALHTRDAPAPDQFAKLEIVES